MIPFLDTNVILRHVLDDHPDHSPRATALILALDPGDRSVHISATVVFDVVFTLEKRYRRSRADILNTVLPIIELPSVLLPDKGICGEVFDRWLAEPSLSFADSYHLSLAKSLGLTEIISFDRKIEKDPAIRRVEP